MGALLLLLAGAVSLPLVHEGGHALAALVVGGKGIRVERRGGLLFAISAVLPERARARRFFFAAGPCANVVCAGALALSLAGDSDDGARLVVTAAIALAHAAFGVVNLTPRPGYDGAEVFARAAAAPLRRESRESRAS